MTTSDYSVSGRSGIAKSLAPCVRRLLADHIIALRQGSQTAAAILPWTAVAYLGAEPPVGENYFAEDATKLLAAPIMPASGPTGETARLNVTQLAQTWPKVLDKIQDGTMVTFIHSKAPVGLFVPVMVLQKLAGRSLPGDGDQRLKAGIRDVLDLEQAVYEWCHTSPTQRIARGLRNPSGPF